MSIVNEKESIKKTSKKQRKEITVVRNKNKNAEIYWIINRLLLLFCGRCCVLKQHDSQAHHIDC